MRRLLVGRERRARRLLSTAGSASHLLRVAHRFAAACGRRSPSGRLYRLGAGHSFSTRHHFLRMTSGCLQVGGGRRGMALTQAHNAPKRRNTLAQGNALGTNQLKPTALNGRHIPRHPKRPLKHIQRTIQTDRRASSRPRIIPKRTKPANQGQNWQQCLPRQRGSCLKAAAHCCQTAACKPDSAPRAQRRKYFPR